MRFNVLAGMAVGLLAVGCAGTERGAAGPARLAAPEFAHVVDMSGAPAPNLIVDAKRLADSWVVYDQDLDKQDPCGRVEGGVTAGVHRVLRFTVTTPNIGDADVFIGNPFDRLSDGLFEFSSCHHHFHFRHYALYELVEPGPSGRVWRAAKKGFCMIDTTPWQFAGGGGVGRWTYRSCGTFQGISVGWADTYNKHLSGQYFVVDGGDGQPVVPPGGYILRVTVNPGFVPQENERCPVLEKILANGKPLCHNFSESSYDDNVAEVQITIPDHTGKRGFGAGSGNPPDTDLIDDENRPDAP